MLRIPKLLTHSQGFYFVRVVGPDGKRHDHNFGRDIKIACDQYRRFVANFCMGADQPGVASSDFTIAEIVAQYLDTIRDRYEPTRSFMDYKRAGELLVKMFGGLSIESVGVTHIRQLVRSMVSSGLARRTINQRIDAIKKVFQYALDGDLITAEHYYKIKSVPRVRMDDTRVKPGRIVPPVEVDVVRRTLPYLSPMIADMVTVQLHSGMRAGEICRMRWSEIDRSGEVWMYRSAHHKTASKGHTRTIPLGPQCREVLDRYGVPPGGYVFCTPAGCYNSSSYGRAVKRGVTEAIKAGAITPAERWTSHQLRHRAGTDARAMFGIDAAQLLLGHANVRTTERYALPDESRVIECAKTLG